MQCITIVNTVTLNFLIFFLYRFFGYVVLPSCTVADFLLDKWNGILHEKHCSNYLMLQIMLSFFPLENLFSLGSWYQDIILLSSQWMNFII